jgi:hypothetical protein
VTNPATTDALESRWRPLSAEEETVAQTLLDDAWLMLRRRFSSLADDVLTDDDLSADAVRVMCSAVLRVMRNPDGFKRESIDDWSGERDSGTADGSLYFTDAELAALSDSSAVGRGPSFSFSLLPTNYPDSRFP